MARETLHWDRPFHTVRAGSFENGDIVWFPEGGLNASYNCVDRWAFKHPDKVSMRPLLRSSPVARSAGRVFRVHLCICAPESHLGVRMYVSRDGD